ncbi:hypothetical protein CVU75_02755 [Candidatus Dependentiae bacterium HGW-Dependentiae-1]|nr:MAG: hypothetical protein CVU75_02755 [Candidatus Dependentiae bacterium HGW-Dependentiae-1]
MLIPQCKRKEGLRGRVGPIVAGVVFAVLLVITGFNFFYNSKKYSTDLISKDLKVLQDIFLLIDKQCKILGFDYQKNPINFLNVGSFEGSEVGPMNLTYPTQWKGPYIEKNPTQQGLEYQIVRTQKGYFITPGDGVMLPNGKMIGKEIVLDERADIQAMMKDDGALQFKGQALAAPLPLKTGAWQKVIQELADTPVEVGMAESDVSAQASA